MKILNQNTFYRKAVRAEHLKLKRSPVWLAFIALPMISAFFGTFNYLNNIEILKSEWLSLWTQHSLFLCYFFMPALIGTYCSYLWRLEHTHHNWNSFLTSPIPLSALYFGKLSQAVFMTILGNLWIFFLYYICGKLSGLNSAFPKDAVSWFFFGTIGAIVICCVQLFFSMIIRSFAIPIGIAMAGGILGLLVTNKGMGLRYPYSLYSIGMRANNPNLKLDVTVHLVNSIGYIILFVALSVLYLRKHEISAN